MMNFIYENQTNRFQILFEIYKRSNADIDYVMDLQELASNIGVGMRAFQSAFKYLYMQDLISMKHQSSQGNMNGYPTSITHKGIKALEKVFREETESTEYFPAYREMSM
jgi:predicted transcriptional regulator